MHEERGCPDGREQARERGAAAADARAGARRAAGRTRNPEPGTPANRRRRAARFGPPRRECAGNPARANRQLQTAQTPPGRKRAGHRPRHRRGGTAAPGVRRKTAAVKPDSAPSPPSPPARRRRACAGCARRARGLYRHPHGDQPCGRRRGRFGHAVSAARRRLAGFHRYRNPRPGRNASRRLCRNGRRGCRGVFGLWQ